MNWRERYGTLYIKDRTNKHPVGMATGYFRPTFPNVNKANGLTTFVIKFLKWSGWDANRVSSAGRYLNGRYIPSTTRKGTADIHAIIKGRHVSIEIKVGKDRMSQDQYLEAERIQRAGGLYWVVRSPEMFLELYDDYLATI